jgi:hypothetical protein
MADPHLIGMAVADRCFVVIQRMEVSTLIRKHVAIGLALILTVLSFASPLPVRAQSDTQIEKIRARVQILSAVKDSQIEVKFRASTSSRERSFL